VIGVRLRLYLVDGSFLDVRYPTDHEYSFHWQVEDKVYRGFAEELRGSQVDLSSL
jgi:hypothetical protein